MRTESTNSAAGWSGALELEQPTVMGAPAPEIDADGAAELIAEAILVRAGHGDPQRLLQLLRDAQLWVEIEPEGDAAAPSVRTVQAQGLQWLAVHTSPTALALWCQVSGRGQDTVHYGILTGAELAEQALPALPPGTGVVLDPASDHTLALPMHAPTETEEQR